MSVSKKLKSRKSKVKDLEDKLNDAISAIKKLKAKVGELEKKVESVAEPTKIGGGDFAEMGQLFDEWMNGEQPNANNIGK